MKNGLYREIIVMAVTTIQAQKLRSGLTILGIVVGITSIVGMSAVVRGFDESLRDAIGQMGPDTIFVSQFSGVSIMSGAELRELLQRPTLTPDDAVAIERQANSIASVSLTLGEGGGPSSTRSRIRYKGERTKPLTIMGTTANYPEVFPTDLELGRFFIEGEVLHRTRIAVLGQTPRIALFPNTDPIGKTVRIASQPYTVVGVIGPRPSPAGLNAGQDDIAIIPHTTYQKQFGLSCLALNGEDFNPL